VNISFYLYIIVASIAIGIFRYQRIHPPLLKWFVPFLGLTLAVEIVGLITSRMNLHNLWMFNFFTCLEFEFYSYIYSRLLEDGRWLRIIRYSMIAFPVLFLVNIYVVEGFYRFHTITYRIGSVMIVCWCYLYFRQLMRSPGYESIFRNPFFWVSTGLLFFYTGFFFYMSAAFILLYARVDRIVWDAISGTLNIILYGCFLISFLCQATPKRK